MKIKDIEDPKVQQMAVVETIKERPEYTLENILKIGLIRAFIWRKSPQNNSFWYKIYDGVAPLYTDKDLWYKCIKGNVDGRFITNKLYKCQNDLFETAKAFIDETGVPSGFIINSNNFILATPEEVYNHLKQKDVSNPTYGKNTIYRQGYPEILEKEVKELEKENKKLNKLVDDIWSETVCIKAFNHRLDMIRHLIKYHRNPYIVGTTQTVEIDGKKYEVTINKEI